MSLKIEWMKMKLKQLDFLCGMTAFVQEPLI